LLCPGTGTYTVTDSFNGTTLHFGPDFVREKMMLKIKPVHGIAKEKKSLEVRDKMIIRHRNFWGLSPSILLSAYIKNEMFS
jgi:hypothetical protein